MPLKVVCFCRYLTVVDIAWRPDDWNALKFIHAIKGRRINGYAEVPILGTRKRLNKANLDSAIDWAGLLVTEYFHKNNIRPPFTLVPVPPSTCTQAYRGSSRTLVLARTIARNAKSEIKVVDCLRWRKRQLAASRGGPREPEILYPNLALTKRLDTVHHILVDDVKTSGGHLQACAAALRNGGAKVRIALCIGLTVHDQSKPPFGTTVETICDYNP